MNLAIIPARGGSKRVPKKNIRLFCGKPIIAYSIEAAKESNCFDRIIVSTDDKDIASIAIEWGAEVPFMRPLRLSGDNIGTAPVIKHAIEWLEEEGSCPTLVCCIYATAPFLRATDLKCGLDILGSSNNKYAFSVTNYPFPIQRAVRLTSTGELMMFEPKYYNTRSQDLEGAYHDAGQFYWGHKKVFLQELTIFDKNAFPVFLPCYRVQDIDTIDDWIRAELMFRALSHKKIT